MDSLMTIMEKKAQEALDALQKSGIEPPDEPYGMSFMMVVYNNDEKEVVGLSFNYEREKKMWAVNFQNDQLEINSENKN